MPAEPICEEPARLAFGTLLGGRSQSRAPAVAAGRVGKRGEVGGHGFAAIVGNAARPVRPRTPGSAGVRGIGGGRERHLPPRKRRRGPWVTRRPAIGSCCKLRRPLPAVVIPMLLIAGRREGLFELQVRNPPWCDRAGTTTCQEFRERPIVDTQSDTLVSRRCTQDCRGHASGMLRSSGAARAGSELPARSHP